MKMAKKPTEIKSFPGAAVQAHLTAAGALPSETQYKDMTDGQLVDTCGKDASKWAAAFCQCARKLGYSPMDQEWVQGWFACAIERGIDIHMGRSASRQ
jgi:hypothetical protein